MKKLLIILISGMLTAFSAYGNELEVIDLKHRSADELMPIIRPLLDKDEMVSGMNYQLILRASPRSIAQIRHLLDSIDTMPRRLTITVMQDVDSETVARLLEASGTVRLGRNATLTVPGNAGNGVKIISTRTLEDDRKTQHLQVLEGNRALVRTGQSVAVPQRQVVQNAWGTQVIDTTQYRDVSSGFYVLPRVNGDNVTLEISSQNDSLAPNQNQNGYPTTRIQNTSSTVSGHLGEWIEIGGLGQQGSSVSSGFVSHSTTRLNEQRNILIKVDEEK